MEKIAKGLILKGTVHRIYPGGSHGIYALALINDPGPITRLTFSLKTPTWQETREPLLGESVFLSKIVEKRSGWQAREAHFWAMSDEEQRIKSLPLKERLALFAEKSQSYSGCSNVITTFNNGNSQINPALMALDEEEKILVFREILKDMLNMGACGRLGSDGDTVALTVSADGRQIRAWRRFPEIIIKNSAEGENWLLEVLGQKEIVERYLNELLALTNLRKATLPNGLDLYLNWQ